MFRRLFGSRKVTWLTTEVLRDAMRAGTTSLIENGSDCYCLSSDNRYAILVREHAAWTASGSTGEAWHSGNYAPKDGTKGRRLVNIFKLSTPDGPGQWYKLFVPNDVVIVSLNAFIDDPTEFVLETESASFGFPFGKLDGFMWDALIGFAETEDDIRKTFARFVSL